LQVTNVAGVVARTAAAGGRDGLDDLELAVNRPVKMMLADKADSVAAAIADAGRTAPSGDSPEPGGTPLVEYKVDGFRVQVHSTPEETRVFTRRLEDVTHQFPDVVDAVESGFDADSFVIDGEVLGYDPDTERPVPFQQLSRRIKRKYDVDELVAEVPVVLYAFDLLAVEGKTLLTTPLTDRLDELETRLDGEAMAFERMPNVTTDDTEAATSFYKDALAAGHEGVMVKNPAAAYQPGKRVGYMLKVKPTMEPLDLTITRAKWSEGRRSNNLGRLYLGCRDAETGQFREVGRLSTGFSDEQLADLTERLEANVVAEDGREVDLEPTEVIEVAYEEIQTSPEYDSGYALRFPRFERFRDDLGTDEVDSLARIESLYEGQ
jgi:DNA ligase-1